MSKHVQIKPVHRSEFDVDRLALALLDIVDLLDDPTLAAVALDGQRELARLGLPARRLPRREAAA